MKIFCRVLLGTVVLAVLGGCERPAKSDYFFGRADVFMDTGSIFAARANIGTTYQTYHERLPEVVGRFSNIKDIWPTEIGSEAKESFRDAVELWLIADRAWGRLVNREGWQDLTTEESGAIDRAALRHTNLGLSKISSLDDLISKSMSAGSMDFQIGREKLGTVFSSR